MVSAAPQADSKNQRTRTQRMLTRRHKGTRLGQGLYVAFHSTDDAYNVHPLVPSCLCVSLVHLCHPAFCLRLKPIPKPIQARRQLRFCHRQAFGAEMVASGEKVKLDLRFGARGSHRDASSVR